MTDHGGFPEHGIPGLTAKPELTPAAHARSNALNNKRKRDSIHDSANDHLTGSGDPQRPSQFKRAVPHNTTSGSAVNANSDQASNPYLAQHAPGPGEETVSHPSNNAFDFGPLGDQDPRLHQNDASNLSNVTATAEAALSKHFQMTVPQPTDMSFQTNNSADDEDPSYMEHGTSASHPGAADYNLGVLKDGSPSQSGNGVSGSAQKPAVGSDEWHKIRKDNHKEVERRRRETINEGINELAKIVPGCEKNKGAVLQRAVQYITQLKENETSNIEKWTLEKLLTEQAINELGANVEKYKAELQKAWREAEMWKKAAESAGLVPDEMRGERVGVEHMHGRGEGMGERGES